MKAVLMAIGLLLLSGCATVGSGSPWAGLAGSCAKPSQDQELALNLADDMVKDGKLYASLANLQGLPDGLAAVRLRKAKIYRQLGRSEAGPLYRSLLGGCLAAEGEHGLGQLASGRGDNDQALAYLQRAVQLMPVDEKIRNDLGVVYFNQRRLEEARFEFLTAMELKPNDQLAAVNLLALLIYQDNWQQATAWVKRIGLGPEQVTRAQAWAQKLKAPDNLNRARVAALAAPLPVPNNLISQRSR